MDGSIYNNSIIYGPVFMETGLEVSMFPQCYVLRLHVEIPTTENAFTAKSATLAEKA